jgi:hypothetical protein
MCGKYQAVSALDTLQRSGDCEKLSVCPTGTGETASQSLWPWQIPGISKAKRAIFTRNHLILKRG